MSDHKPARPGRPARKKPSRPDRDQLQERIEFTFFLLCRRLYKGDIKRILAKKYSVCPRTCEDYIARARATLLTESGKTQEEHRLESLRFYESIIAGDGLGESTLRDRLHAQERIDKLFGLESPQKHDVTTSRRAEDLSDDQLANIAAGCGPGNDQTPPGPQKPD